MPQKTLNKIIAISIALAALCIVAVTSIFPDQASNDSTPEEVSITNTAQYRRVFIKDTHDYIDNSTKESIEHTLYYYIDLEKPNLFTGVIRKESYSKQIAPSGQPIINLLIDVYPSESTYKLTLIGHRDVYSVNVDCAPENEQINPHKECVNRHHHD